MQHSFLQLLKAPQSIFQLKVTESKVHRGETNADKPSVTFLLKIQQSSNIGSIRAINEDWEIPIERITDITVIVVILK